MTSPRILASSWASYRKASRLVASWRRSCSRKSSMPAKSLARPNNSVSSSGVQGQRRPSSLEGKDLYASTARSDKGTSRGLSFLVSGRWATRRSRSRFTFSIITNSLRRIAESPRMMIARGRSASTVAAASKSFSSSPSLYRRLRFLPLEGLQMSEMGFCTGIPHSFLACR